MNAFHRSLAIGNLALLALASADAQSRPGVTDARAPSTTPPKSGVGEMRVAPETPHGARTYSMWITMTARGKATPAERIASVSFDGPGAAEHATTSGTRSAPLAVRIEKHAGGSDAALKQALLSHTLIHEVGFRMTDAQAVVHVVVLRDVRVVTLQILAAANSPAGTSPIEQFVLDYRSIQMDGKDPSKVATDAWTGNR